MVEWNVGFKTKKEEDLPATLEPENAFFSDFDALSVISHRHIASHKMDWTMKREPNGTSSRNKDARE